MKSVFRFSVFTFLVVGFSFSLSAEEEPHAAILLSRKLPPYEEAGRGIQESLNRKYPDLKIQTVVLEGDVEKGRDVAVAYAHYKKAVIFSVGTEAARSALSFTHDLPVIMAMMYDPLVENAVQKETLPRVYGAPLKISWASQFQTLKKLVPQWGKYAVIFLPQTGQDFKAGAEAAAGRQGLTVEFFPLVSLAEFLSTVQTASTRSDALLMILDRALYNPATLKELFLLSARRKYPLVTFSPNHVRSGALLSLSTPFYQNGATAAQIGAKLLEGNPPADHFAETPALWVAWNRKTALALGIKLTLTAQERVNEFVGE